MSYFDKLLDGSPLKMGNTQEHWHAKSGGETSGCGDGGGGQYIWSFEVSLIGTAQSLRWSKHNFTRRKRQSGLSRPCTPGTMCSTILLMPAPSLTAGLMQSQLKLKGVL